MIRAIFTLFLFFSSPVFAGAPSDKHVDHLPACPQGEHAPTQKLIDEFHHVLEGKAHAHSAQEALKNILTWPGLKAWAQSFNIRKSFSRACRFYNIKSVDGRIQKHVANLAFILPVSHSIEMLSGPVLSSLSIASGWPAQVTGAISVAGAVISIPGIDPICILIYSLYPLQPVENTITWAREKTISALYFSGKITGLLQLGRLLSDQWHLYRLRKGDISFSQDFVSVTLPSGNKINYYWDETRTYFTRMIAPAHLTVSEVKAALAPLPRNLRSATIEALQSLDGQSEQPFYITHVQGDQSTVTITWTPYAVRTQFLSRCADILSQAPVTSADKRVTDTRNGRNH